MLDARQRARARATEDALAGFVSRLKLNKRWPCPDCGREGPTDPLRLLEVRREDGSGYHGGCGPCNQDDLIEAAEKALAMPADAALE